MWGQFCIRTNGKSNSRYMKAVIQTSPLQKYTSTFHSDFFDLLGFLINPFLPADFFCGTHELLQLLYFLHGKERQNNVKKEAKKLHLIPALKGYESASIGTNDAFHT